MKSQTFGNLYHVGNNVYCNDSIVICRLHKLILVYYKSQNRFSFFLLKRLKESKLYLPLVTLMNAEDPRQQLKVLIGEDSPDPLSCKVEEYEVKLVPQYLGNFELVITYETFDSILLSENKACIVLLDSLSVIDPVDLFRLICSTNSPNLFAKTELVSKLKYAFQVIPTQTVVLMSLKSLKENLKFFPNDISHITIHILHKKQRIKPNYPGINFTVVYLDEDKKLAELNLPTIDSNQPLYAVKKVITLDGFF